MSSSGGNNPRPTGAGEYNQGATLRKPTYTTDSAGQKIANYQDVDCTYVKLHTLTSREQMRARSVEMQTTHRVTMRYRDDIGDDWQIVWTDPRGVHVGNVESIIETIRRSELELQVVEIVANG